MKIKDVMKKDIKYVPSGTNLKQAARLMTVMDCGFIPVADVRQDRLLGVVTDRDIVIRAISEGKDANTTSVDQIMTDRVLYCFADNEVESAANSMRDEHVYRLIVLNNKEEKKLCGVITLGDILRRNELDLAAMAASGITGQAA